MQTKEVVIIGAGIVGAAAAYQFARQRVKTTLIDKGHIGQATAAGAGIVSPGSSYTPLADYYPLSYQATSYYNTLLSQLADDGETETGYEVVGALYVATSDEEVERLKVMRRLIEDRRQAGVPNIGDVSQITSEEARSLFPAFGHIPAAIHITGSARLNGRLLRDALKRAAQKQGAELVIGTADVHIENGVAKGVFVNGNRMTADAVVMATGAWTNCLREQLGIHVPVQPQKGQILHIDMPEATGTWPIVLGFHSHYMLTFPDNRVVVGATREDNSGFDTEVTVGGVQEVIQQALRIAPGLAKGKVHEVRVGLRPATPDHLPVLGPVPGITGLYLATGHGANGLTAGAYSGVAVADSVMGRLVTIDLSPFSVTRFAKQMD
ncbi:NAD(P)/FAD-dependent oxidoreductase [Alicyclobacillus acidoterrestris]|uniref:FAD-dependent oxidoreductase n=1 Tax=Alicyclobacillus acidoterrestris (strain ATCC 49025 / DSM 3922 / CIP 106132 / NCIMB 13137 / GD3B) TaxID=1356854 RepID=T0BNY7_ALIAG|nr:FAD-dependent oxidoreductase [Alicyclobacillus acidoterrestris]EPZ42250.1 hypothetical protein N007_15640 [Alicyclobacillus acidoterrestris ATCC 49025]UNO47860.1 FAD-dependent oxidoreductase [Alicyclobacillus acidoterrestris]